MRWMPCVLMGALAAMSKLVRCYSELIRLPTWEERFRYLKLDGFVGVDTFGYDRYLNQALYSSQEWKAIKRKLIIRDGGTDLGVEGLGINYGLTLHHK